MKKFVLNTLTIIFLFLALASLFMLFKAKSVWGDIYIEQIFVHLEDATGVISKNMLLNYIFGVSFSFVLSFFLSFLLKRRYLWCISVFCFLFIFYEIGGISYLRNKNIYTDIYEKEYQDPKTLTYQFPNKKRNLILIYLESMEKEYANLPKTNENLIPNITQYMEHNLSFDGFHQISHQDYTIAAMVESLCGVPYREKFLKDYKEYQNFLPGLICFPEILKENGYNTYFIKGADADFARTRLFMEKHGFEEVYGKNEIDQKFSYPLKDNIGAFGGYKDSTLYEIIKEKLENIKDREPFFLSFITLDMHKPDVYLDENCKKTSNIRKDIVVCEDQMLHQFLNWLQEQDFYQNTTVVVLGDHTETGKNDIYPNILERHIINFILNPADKKEKIKHKFFTTLDLAPTILNAIGVNINKDSFGLGRSLLSPSPTLFEQMKLKLETELSKESKIYKNFEKVVLFKKPKYENYSSFGNIISNPKDIEKYATFVNPLFDILFLDEMSFSLPSVSSRYVRFEISFKSIFGSNQTKEISVFINDKKFDTWKISVQEKQPFIKRIDIPKNMIKNQKLVINFQNEEKQENIPGIGIVSFKFENFDP